MMRGNVGLSLRAFVLAWTCVLALHSLCAADEPEQVEPSLAERVEQQQRELDELRALVEKKAAPAKSPATYKLGGQVVMDALWFNQNDASRAAVGDVDDAFGFRRARLYLTGEMHEIFNYAMGFDFAQGSATDGRPTFLDNYLGVTDLPVIGNLRIGHFFEPFMLERSGSNRNTTFMERSLADAFAPSRNLGIMIFDQSEDQRFYWALGSFRGASDNFGDESGDQEGQTVDGRLVWRPYYDEASNGRYYLHLGGGYSYRQAADGQVRFRSRPEAFGNSDANNPATPYFVDTGTLAAHYSQLFGGELLWVNGPLCIQGEYVGAPVNRTTGNDTLFHGGYLNVSYMLTGEHRPYNRAGAIIDRVIPFENFFRVRTSDGRIVTGLGAWEVAGRISYIDLASQDIDGGRLRDITFGINWYASPNHRFRFNYIQAHLDRFSATTDTNIFGVRFDMDF
jgi:phosphate-selective porin OprO/OprP